MATAKTKKTLATLSTKTLRLVAPKLSLKVAEKYLFSPKRRLNAWPKNVQLFTMPSRYGEIQGYKMGAGKCIWLVHGWNSCAYDFLTIMRFLSDLGYCCICFDLPGHGSSTVKGSNLPKMVKAFDDISSSMYNPSMVITHGTGASVVANSLWFEQYNKDLLLISPIFNEYRHWQTQARQRGMDSMLFEQLIFDISKRERMFIPDMKLDDRIADFEGNVKILHDKNDGIAQYRDSKKFSTEQFVSLYGTHNLGHLRILKSKTLMKVVESFGLTNLEAGALFI